MTKYHIDLETKSQTDLLKEGGHNYATCPTTALICMCYAKDDEPVQLWLPGEPFPEDLAEHIAPAVCCSRITHRLKG